MLPVTRRGTRRVTSEPTDLIRRELDRMFSGWPTLDESVGDGLVGQYPVDIHEDETNVYVEAELPGFTKDQISVDLEEGVLSITAERKASEEEHNGRTPHLHERRFTRVQRQFTLPATVEEDSVDATFADGVLKLTLGKSEQSRRRHIEIK